jgi:hypothetical protein
MSNALDKVALAKAEEVVQSLIGAIELRAYTDSLKAIVSGLAFYRALAASLNDECDALASRLADVKLSDADVERRAVSA